MKKPIKSLLLVFLNHVHEDKWSGREENIDFRISRTTTPQSFCWSIDGYWY